MFLDSRPYNLHDIGNRLELVADMIRDIGASKAAGTGDLSDPRMTRRDKTVPSALTWSSVARARTGGRSAWANRYAVWS